MADITQEQVVDYLSGLTVMDLVALCGMYVTLGNMINTWGIDLDDPVRRRLPPGVTEESFAD